MMLAKLAVLMFILTPLLLAFSVPHSASGGTVRGIAKHYSPGVFARVAHNRGMSLRHDVAGYASVPDCRWIGSVVQARINGGKWERYQVLDCSQYRDYARHIRTGLVIEIDAASARRNHFYGEGRAPAVVVYPRGNRE